MDDLIACLDCDSLAGEAMMCQQRYSANGSSTTYSGSLESDPNGLRAGVGAITSEICT
jgi:hypothetical protein